MLIKLKANIPEIIVGVLLTVAVFAMGMTYESSRHPPSNQNTPAGTQKSSGVIATQQPEEKLTDWFLVLFNGLLFGSTVLLWRANNRSAKIAERALTELEAPFIVIKINAPGIDWGPLRKITFDDLKFSFANYGRSPAHILEFIERITPVAIGHGMPEAIDPHKQRGTPMPYGIIAAPQGETQEFKTITNLDFFEDSSPGLFPEVTRKAFFQGYVRYSDIFDHSY